MAVDYATLKKGGFMRQKQKNNFSLRLAVVGGNLTAKQLAKIAEVAEKYGDGHVHLTSRQGVEIPFIKLDQIDEVKAELEKGDCKPGVCGPRVRTVTACQGNQICPSGNIDSYDIAQKLDERYFARELPHKFKFGVTGCQNNCLKSEENDVGVKGAAIVKWKEDACIQCGVCVKACRTDAIKLEDGKIEVHSKHHINAVRILCDQLLQSRSSLKNPFGMERHGIQATVSNYFFLCVQMHRRKSALISNALADGISGKYHFPLILFHRHFLFCRRLAVR